MSLCKKKYKKTHIVSVVKQWHGTNENQFITSTGNEKMAETTGASLFYMGLQK